MNKTAVVRLVPRSQMLDDVLNRRVGLGVIYVFSENPPIAIKDRPDVWVFDFKRNDANHNKIQIAKLASNLCGVTKIMAFHVDAESVGSNVFCNMICLNYGITFINRDHGKVDYSATFLKYKKQVEDAITYSAIVRNGKTMRWVVDVVVDGGVRMMFVTAGKKNDVLISVGPHAYDLSLTVAESELIQILDFVPIQEVSRYINAKIKQHKTQKRYEERNRKKIAGACV